jgi:TonB family protein
MIPLLIEAAARSLVLGLLVWLALAAAKPRNPYIHKTVWLGVLLASLAMPVLLWLDVAPAIEAPSYVLSLRSGNAPMASMLQSWAVPGAGNGSSALGRAGAALYALVALALLGRFCAGLARMARIRRIAAPVQASWVGMNDIRVSERLCSPATFGSTILLPREFEQWSAPKLAAVLCHERSHVRQKDCYVLWLARAHACVFWINPLAWVILRRLAMLAETTSDDAVVTETGDRPAYAQLLLEIAVSRPASAAAMGMARANVSVRIERIISDIAPATPAKRWQKALSIALLLPVVVISAASLQVPGLALADTPFDQTSQSGNAARIVSMPPLNEQAKYYPGEAKRKGIDGRVKITIRLDSGAHLTSTQILEEAPAGMGFGDAAAQIVRTYEFANPAGAAREFDLVVNFELDESSGHQASAAATLGG